MAVEISAADRDRIVRDTAKAGKPAPAWVAADPKLKAIYDQNLPTPAGTVPPKKKPAATPAAKPAAPPTSKGGVAGGGTPSRSGSGRARGGRSGSGRARASSPRPAGPIPLPRTLTKMAGGSAAGGLFLAVFLYPIALAVFQHGPAGLGMWLKAKFLNKASGVPQPTDGGGPLTKLQGPIVPKTGPGTPGAAPAPSGSVNRPGVGGQTAPTASVFNPSWADMMKNRERIPA